VTAGFTPDEQDRQRLSDRIDSERWQIAIRELCRSGLLRVEGERVYPTQAAPASSTSWKPGSKRPAGCRVAAFGLK
jgi:hypothetical protein